MLKFLLALLFIVVALTACASLRKHDIEANLISEMEKNCKKVEVKMDYDQRVYVITYTGKVSKGRCPIALIQGWKNDGTMEKKEVEICGCKDK
ncbi:MAG: hypothetical protein ACHQ0Y_12195 [Thermodesulfovibrionales bacterium]